MALLKNQFKWDQNDVIESIKHQVTFRKSVFYLITYILHHIHVYLHLNSVIKPVSISLMC